LVSTIPGAGTVGGPAAAAAINLVGWLVGTGLDIERYETLKQEINAMNRGVPPDGEKPMDVASAFIGTSLAALIAHRRNELYETAHMIRRSLGPGIGQETYRARMADLEAVVATWDGLRKIDPIETAKGLAKSHDALVEAVNSSKVNMSDLVQKLQDFGSKISDLQTALTAASGSGKSAAASPTSSSSSKKGS